MKTLLVLAEHPNFAREVTAAINAEQYRVVHRANIEEAEPMLVHGLVDACLIDVEATTVQGVWSLEKLRRRSPKCPVIVYTSARVWDWEEEAYLQGVTQILTKPVRARLLSALLERLWPNPASERPLPPFANPVATEPSNSAEAETIHGAPRTLGVLRDFSGILTHSLNAEGMLKQFLLQLRDILSVNRAAIFLRQPFGAFGGAPADADTRRLRAACAVGLAPSLLQHFELTFEGGIGGHIFRLGRILRRSSQEARNDLETQKEFELLGAQVAVPILDRETVLGVAVFDGRITGEPLVNAELELIFHLLEQLGLAIKNIWLHDQLAGNHEMLTEVLRELSSACVVVSRELAVLHANKTARKYFSRGERRSEMEFSDLPHALGSKIYQVLKTGSGISNFKHEPEDAPGTIYNVSIVPFQRQPDGLPASALLMAEDLTQSEQFHRLEIETANLRLIKTMAEKLTNEVGNALVPLAVHQQMLAERLARKNVDIDSLKVMERDLAESIRRVSRLNTQMRYLARDNVLTQEAFPLAPVVEEAFEEARRHQMAKSSQLKLETSNHAMVFTGDRAALKHAFAEVMLNAIQANPAEPTVGVRIHSDGNGNGSQHVNIEVQDNGAGFTAEAIQKAPTPFFTTRVVGLGLGLAVSRKIVENHNGKLEILTPQAGQAGIVRISLPTGTSMALHA